MHETLPSIDRDLLIYMRERARGTLEDFIDEIPAEIIRGGYVYEGQDKGKNLVDPTFYKCQRSWFMRVFGLTGSIIRNNFFSKKLKQEALNFEEMIKIRKKMPYDQDSDSRKDEFGDWHRMTTREEIDAANAFLQSLIQEIEGMLN